tara:strand:- start:13764 stop:14999 length:1236 start_codon:yes stop_codon:yes gene_type:complete
MPAKIRFYKEAKTAISTPASPYVTFFAGADALIPDGSGNLNHLTAIDSAGNQLVIPYLDEALTNTRGLAFKADVDMNALLTLTSMTASVIGRVYLASTGTTQTSQYNTTTTQATDALSFAAYNNLLEDNIVISTTGITYITGSLPTSTYANNYFSLSNGSGDTASLGSLPDSNEYQFRVYDPSNSHQIIITPTGMTIEVSGTSVFQFSSTEGLVGTSSSGSFGSVISSGITLQSVSSPSGTTGGFTGPSSEILTQTVQVTSAQTAVLDSYHNRITLIEAPGGNELLDVITVTGKFNYLGNLTGDQPYSANTNVYIVSSGTTATTYMHEGAMFYSPTFLSGQTGNGTVYSKFTQPPLTSFQSISTDKATNLSNMGLGQPIMIATQGTPDGQGSPVANYDNFAINVVYRKTQF